MPYYKVASSSVGVGGGHVREEVGECTGGGEVRVRGDRYRPG